MKKTLHVFRTTSLAGLLILGLSCAKKADLPSEETVTPPGTTLFTATDIIKSWASGCLAGTDPIKGADHYKITMNLSGTNTYSSSTQWFSTNCNGGNAKIMYSSAGTFTVGAEITGGQSIVFNATSSTLMTFINTVNQTAVNTACGGTSPWNGGVNAGDFGLAKNSYMMSCTSLVMPNSGNATISNVATYANSILTIGLSYPNIPGVFNGTSVPTSATLQLF